MLHLAEITGDVIAVIAIVGGMAVVLTGIIASTLDSVLRSRHREETRREIAAYVAEGSISAIDAAALLNAGAGRARQRGLDGVKVGVIAARCADRAVRGSAEPGPAS